MIRMCYKKATTTTFNPLENEEAYANPFSPPRPFIIYHGKEGEREFRKPSLFVLLLCTSLPNRHVLLLPFWFQDAAASLLKLSGGGVSSVPL